MASIYDLCKTTIIFCQHHSPLVSKMMTEYMMHPFLKQLLTVYVLCLYRFYKNLLFRSHFWSNGKWQRCSALCNDSKSWTLKNVGGKNVTWSNISSWLVLHLLNNWLSLKDGLIFYCSTQFWIYIKETDGAEDWRCCLRQPYNLLNVIGLYCWVYVLEY